MVRDTAVVEERKLAEARSIDKRWYKVTLGLLKIIPMLLATCDALNTLTCLLGYDLVVLSFIGGVSFLTLTFLYLVSYVFRFCIYHRMFLHYVVINDLLSIYDYHIGIPISDVGLFLVHIIDFFKFLFCKLPQSYTI